MTASQCTMVGAGAMSVLGSGEGGVAAVQAGGQEPDEGLEGGLV